MTTNINFEGKDSGFWILERGETIEITDEMGLYEDHYRSGVA
jgi:hypothetical protein